MEIKTLLNSEFETLLLEGDVGKLVKCVPFLSPHRLPTVDQVIKLYFVLRNQDRFKKTSTSEVSELVAKIILNYWVMANIPTADIRTITARMVRLVERYNKIVKHKSHKNPENKLKRDKIMLTVFASFLTLLLLKQKMIL